MLAAGMAGGLLGFLRYNFPPARIYLGDGGAYFLGFQIGLFSLIDSRKGTVFAVLIAPLFVLALPIIDTALAILRRGVHGLSIFRPDRQHIHHRLLRVGLSRRQVVLFSYSLTSLFLVLGLVTVWTRGQFLSVLLGVVVLVLLLCAGQFSFSREWFAVRRVMGNSLEMRQEIQYALLMARWLALEGNRGRTDLELWDDLVFVARKLGFSEVKLTHVDGQFSWQAEGSSATAWSASYQLQGGQFGMLKLSSHSGTQARAAIENDSGQIPLRGIANERLFEILSELVAEAWAKTANSWRKQKNKNGGPKFESVSEAREAARVRSKELPEMILAGNEDQITMGR
jgi:hypothetical protein